MVNATCFSYQLYVGIFMVFVCRFGKNNMRNVVAGHRWILCRGFGFMSLILCRFSLIL